MIDLIGAPFDLTGPKRGSRLGPAALRLAGLIPTLEALDLAVEDRGDIVADDIPSAGDGMRNFAPLLRSVMRLRGLVKASLDSHGLPIVLGGDHAVVAGGISAGLAHYGPDLAVLWIDAHADVNTPATSVTGHIHGMPLAALWGRDSQTGDATVDRQWGDLLDVLGPPFLNPQRTAWLGLRDVDPAERPALTDAAITMHAIDRHGIAAAVGQIAAWHQALGQPPLWISFDVDALDPILAPGTGTAVRGGLTYREAHLIAELLHQEAGRQIVGVDIVEVNPLVDRNNETAVMAVEWIASLFGKTILGPERS